MVAVAFIITITWACKSVSGGTIEIGQSWLNVAMFSLAAVFSGEYLGSAVISFIKDKWGKGKEKQGHIGKEE